MSNMTIGGRDHALGSELPSVPAGAYARYSSDSQRDASIDDQVRICRAEIERHGWYLVQVYADAVLTGALDLPPRVPEAGPGRACVPFSSAAIKRL